MEWPESVSYRLKLYRDERDEKLSTTLDQINKYLKEEKNKDFAEALKLTGDEIPLNNLFFMKIRASYFPNPDGELEDLDSKIKQKKEEIEKQLS